MPPLTDHFAGPNHIPPGRLWFGAVGAAVCWALQGFTCFLISTQACAAGFTGWGLRVVLGGVSAVYLGVALTAGWISYRNWRRRANGQSLLQTDSEDREEYMALAGVFVAATAGVGLIWSAIPPIFGALCNTVR